LFHFSYLAYQINAYEFKQKNQNIVQLSSSKSMDKRSSKASLQNERTLSQSPRLPEVLPFLKRTPKGDKLESTISTLDGESKSRTDERNIGKSKIVRIN